MKAESLKKLSQDFSRTESRILGALSKLDDFLLNPELQTHSGTVPGTFQNTNVESQGTNEDDSQSDPHPKAGLFRSQTTQNSGPEFGHDIVTGATKQIRNRHDMVTGATERISNRHDIVTGVTEEVRDGHDMVTTVQKESLCGHDMVTGVTKEIRNAHDMVTGGEEKIRYRPHMVTGIQEEIPYCSRGSSSGKQKKARSTSQPQFRNENTPATIEANQILLALQQLGSNSNSANISNNRISKLPKSLMTTMPVFDGKSEKIELFEDLFQTSSKIHNQLTEEEKIFPFSHAW